MAIERDKAGFQLNFHAIGDVPIALARRFRGSSQSQRLRIAVTA